MPHNRKQLQSLKDNIHIILHGTKEQKEKLQRTFFYIADTPDFMKKLGLTGDFFSVRYGVISRHLGKDAGHEKNIDPRTGGTSGRAQFPSISARPGAGSPDIMPGNSINIPQMGKKSSKKKAARMLLRAAFLRRPWWGNRESRRRALPP